MIDADGFLYRRDLGNGRQVVVMPLTFGRARIGIGPVGAFWNDDEW